jgi:hypothetical protein
VLLAIKARREGAHPRRAVRDDGWHRKQVVRALRRHETVTPSEVGTPRERRRRYGATIKDALTALWEASDRVCGKRLKVMIPTLLPALEQHGRLKLGTADRDLALAISAATIDRLLGDVKVAASGGELRRAGCYSGQSDAKFRSARSTTGKARRRASARSTWSQWHIGGGLVQSDVDNDRRRHGLDRAPAVGDARWLARCRGNGYRACFPGFCAAWTSTTIARL